MSIIKRNSSHVERVLHPIPPVALPFERWGIDFLQNLPTTRSDNNHVITMIDYSTLWVLAKPVKSMSASEVVKFFTMMLYLITGYLLK